MILAINIENTNTVIGCIRDSEFIFVESISTNVTRTELEYAISVKSIFDLYHLELTEVEGAIIASVVPPVTGVVKSAVKKPNVFPLGNIQTVGFGQIFSVNAEISFRAELLLRKLMTI